MTYLGMMCCVALSFCCVMPVLPFSSSLGVLFHAQYLLTLGTHAQATVVGSACLSVCLSVKSHLAYGASVRPENTVTYSVDKEGQKFCGAFSETTLLPRSSIPSIESHTYSRPFSCG